MIRFVNFILLFTFVTFQINILAQDLPTSAITEINVGEGPVNAIAYSRSANRIAIAAANNIHIYDADTYEERMVFVGHTDSVLAVAFSPNGKLLVSGSSDKTGRLWDADLGKLQRTREEHSVPINAVAFSADGKKFWSSGNEDSTIRSWYSVDGGRAGKITFTYTDVFTAIAFSSDGETIVRAFDIISGVDKNFESSAIFLFDLQEGYNGSIFAEHTDSVHALALYAKGETIATGSADKTNPVVGSKR